MMSTIAPDTTTTPDTMLGGAEGQPTAGEVLVCLPPMTQAAQAAAIEVTAEAFPGASVLIAVTTQPGSQASGSNLVSYESARTQTGWSLGAADYMAAADVAQRYGRRCLVIVGDEMPTATMLSSLASSISRGAVDIAVPRLYPGPNDGLVNSALLYPLTRALFGVDIRFPLPYNIALSPRAFEKLSSGARKEAVAGRGEALLWPVAEAASSGLSVQQVETGHDTLPTPYATDFNQLFAEVVGSLFSDIDARAIFWQRARYVSASARPAARICGGANDVGTEVAAMTESYRVAHANLLPIWSLVLPPQSLLALKKLTLAKPGDFVFAPELWARIVYDFALAYHLRTLNANHLLGALTPLYLAWAASHIQSAAGDPANAECQVQETALAFEAERPYFVSRWRWPDRFNP